MAIVPCQMSRAYGRNGRWLESAPIAYVFYIGFEVSMTIHWFSDFVAGALIGTVVGTVVGTSFSRGQMERL